MLDDLRLVEARLASMLARDLRPRAYPKRAPVAVSVHRVRGEPVGYAVGAGGPFVPLAPGEPWGGAWQTAWLRFTGQVPPAWAGAPVELQVELGEASHCGFSAEGLVWRDGEPVQTLAFDHTRVPLTAEARGGEVFRVLVEAAANPDMDRVPPELGRRPAWLDPASGPSGPSKTLVMPGVETVSGGQRLVRAELVSVDREAERTAVDVEVLLDLAGALERADPRRHEILRGLERLADLLDRHEPDRRAARAVLDGLLRPRADRRARVTVAGHSHIDTAWLWPLRETVRKCARTFSTADGLMASDPDYRFACSCAQHHAWMDEHYPGLASRIAERVAEGRWELVGGSWVEQDCNLPGAESLVRAFLVGQRYFQNRFGRLCEVAWLPDVFGYPACLPQLFRGAGMRYFLTQKLSWNELNPPVHSTFRWEGLDGSRVLTHFPPTDTYGGVMTASQLLAGERAFREKGRASRSLYLFGHSDGGGGPSRAMLDRYVRLRDLEGVPAAQLGSVTQFFRDAEAEYPDAPTWRGELYFERHRGTLTSQARLKSLNRRCEAALREAELFSCVAAPGFTYPKAELAEIWRRLLTLHMHDILPGTSISWVNTEAIETLTELLARAAAIATAARAAIAARVATAGPDRVIVVFNSATHERDEVALLAGLDLSVGPWHARGPTGDVSAVQRLGDGRVALRLRVPGLGWAAYTLVPGPLPADASGPPPPVEVGASRLSNGLLSLTWNADGELTSLRDLTIGREVLARGRVANVLELADDRPTWHDAWDLDAWTAQRGRSVGGDAEVEVIEAGPLLAGLRVSRRFGASRARTTLWLRAGERRLDVETLLDWHERREVLRVAIPVDVRGERATYEIQFGHVQRPTHRNTSYDAAMFEVCAHRWAEAADPDYGVALLNDGRYGYDIHAEDTGTTLRMSLLRGTTWPDPDADAGQHALTYALLPHPGDFRSAGVVQAGYALNLPLRAVTRPSQSPPGPAADLPAQGSWLRVEHPGVVVEAVKAAEDADGVIVRLYEAWGCRATVRLHLPAGVDHAVVTDLLERGEPAAGTSAPAGPGGAPAALLDCTDGTLQLEFTPFQIRTLLLSGPGVHPGAGG